jgi:hypothetical protein
MSPSEAVEFTLDKAFDVREGALMDRCPAFGQAIDGDAVELASLR